MNPAMIPTKAERTRSAIIQLLSKRSMTADALAERLNLSILYVRPRVSELVAKEVVVPSGDRGLNASGRLANKWTVA